MKLSKAELKKIEEFRAKIIAAKSRDIVELLEKMDYDIEQPENLKKQLEDARNTLKLLEDIGYDIANLEKLKSQLEAGKIATPELFKIQE
ncbi:MAG: hypothetical protein KBF19_01505 [Negativicutes bacterium]|nr:hypothetical protein [Negativicutes bacterium]